MGAAASTAAETTSGDNASSSPSRCLPTAASSLRKTLILSPSHFQSQSQPQSSSSSPSLSALQDVVLQAVCNDELRRYVLLAWRPGRSSCSSGGGTDTADTAGDSAGGRDSGGDSGGGGEDAHFQEEGPGIALNCIDFVSEVPVCPPPLSVSLCLSVCLLSLSPFSSHMHVFVSVSLWLSVSASPSSGH
jgi:hypothetical protein